MHKEIAASITLKIVELQDENKCWNVLDKSDKHYFY